MLSIGSIGSSGGYYLDLAREDYYLEGGEPLGRWWGRGAESLVGLGSVQRDELRAFLKGFSPDGDTLIQGAGRENHQRGWDLTFSAPKSVSVLWSQADEATRKEIQAAHLEAVKAALSYLQDETAFTRRGKGGTLLERAGLLVALFEHSTSRALDPQLHTHALVMNIGLRDDGTTGTILSKPLFQAKMTAGALYRAELATQLEKRLGCRCEQEAKGTSFVVVGVPDELCKEKSQRRAAIKEQLKAFGSESAQAAATAAYETRRAKEKIPPRCELFADWRTVNEAFRFKADHALNRETKTRDVQKEFFGSLSGALDEITASQSHFTERKLLQQLAVHAQGRGISANDIRDRLKAELTRTSCDIVSLGTSSGQTRYTTKSVLEAERALIDSAQSLDANKKHGASEKNIEATLSKSRRLTDEQREAVRYMTEKGGGLRSLEGWAGTGKTSTLSVAREILEKDGYHVIGAALSAKAAKELEKGAKVESNTIALLDLKMREPALKDVLKHEVKQLARAFAGKDRFEMFEPLRFTNKTVLVIDESAMVATKELAKLTTAVEKAGGMLISVFDRKQLQAIGPGGGAAYLADKFGKADLTGIVRQHEEWMRDAVKQFAKGDAAGALKQYQLAGRLHVAADRDKAMSKLISDWATKETGRRENSLIFVGTRAEVSEVNARCQAARRDLGEITGQPHKSGAYELYKADRVLFTKNSKTIGVENGSLGTVIGFHQVRDIATVKLDSGETVQVPLKKYESLQPGYAVTTHKGQGTTVDNAYLLAGGKMQDLHLSYVQASRAKDSTFIYTDRNEAGDKLDELAKQMSREREKTLAHQISERGEQEHRQQQTIRIQQQRRL
jgi:conjugative relaxase-like TrwC/TraI family protein